MDPRSPSLAAPPGHAPAQTKVVIITLLSVRVVSAPLAMARRGQWRSRVTVLLPGRSFESVFNASGMQDLGMFMSNMGKNLQSPNVIFY